MAGSCSSSVKSTGLPVVLASSRSSFWRWRMGRSSLKLTLPRMFMLSLGLSLRACARVVSLVCWVGVRAGSPGRKGSSSRSLVPPSRTQAGRRGGDGLAEGIAEHVPEDVAQAEIRLIQIALHLEVHLDDAVRIAQQGDGEAEGRSLACSLLTFSPSCSFLMVMSLSPSSRLPCSL